MTAYVHDNYNIRISKFFIIFNPIYFSLYFFVVFYTQDTILDVDTATALC